MVKVAFPLDHQSTQGAQYWWDSIPGLWGNSNSGGGGSSGGYNSGGGGGHSGGGSSGGYNPKPKPEPGPGPGPGPDKKGDLSCITVTGSKNSAQCPRGYISTFCICGNGCQDFDFENDIKCSCSCNNVPFTKARCCKVA
ncbi:resistin-like beta [Pelobates cultripes]|uniref:Resistin-like beta n=1 Tax=Pelobates cultripes TaxID=61616 RepID=A0AAD1RNS4_PELCU|nr:resistin-like beta [Pelobates cultripes]